MNCDQLFGQWRAATAEAVVLSKQLKEATADADPVSRPILLDRLTECAGVASAAYEAYRKALKEATKDLK